MKETFGHDRVLNIATFKHEGTKSALLTACRGLDITVEEGQELSSMIPQERGFLWSLDDCVNGNPDKGRKPVKELITKLNQHEGLLETALGIEGLINGRSIHASGVYVFNHSYLDHCSVMKAPSGQYITSYDMEDVDYTGGLKLDILTVNCLDKIRQTLNLLLEFGLIEWQGSLKATYNKYIHPDVLDYDSPEMWKLLHDKAVMDVFQYEGMTGTQALDQIKPTNLYEMSAGNSIMRLMAQEGQESPLDKYVRFKNNIDLWYTEMEINSLTKDEVEIMKKHLLNVYGVANTQEEIMILSQDPKISNFTISESDELRKAVAKKKIKDLEKVKKKFFDKGIASGASENLLHYVWVYAIMLQAGLTFHSPVETL